MLHYILQEKNVVVGNFISRPNFIRSWLEHEKKVL